MIRYIGKRILGLLPVLLLISIISFALSSISAGDAARVMAEQQYGVPTLEQIEKVRVEEGLDQPITTQYGRWLMAATHGDLGVSYQTQKPVIDELLTRFPITLKLTLMAMAYLVIIAVPIGVFSAIYPNSAIDWSGRFLSFASVSIPSFWLGLVLLYIFGARLQMIPILADSHNIHLILPAFVMAVPMMGIIIRLMRTEFEKVMYSNYICAVRAKGVSETSVLIKHAMKNAILPIVTQLGIIFGSFICGSSIIESVFSIPGLGKYLLEVVSKKDLPVIQGYILYMATFIVLVTLLVDILYSLIDPRIKLDT